MVQGHKWLDMVRLGAPLTAMVVLGCGGSGAGDRPFPPVRLAGEDARQGSATQCAYSARYDVKRGCALDSWGVPLRVRHDNEMSSSFVLIGTAFALDGVLVFDSNDPDLLAQKSFSVLTTGLGRGPHELAARLVYRGNGQGVFSYLKGYRFRTQKAERIDTGSADISVVVHGFEQGGATAPLEQRPAFRFEIGQR